MASGVFSEEDISCPICIDILKNPVVLQCGHNFCSSCIQDFFRYRPKECPACRARASKAYPVNFALKNPTDFFLDKKERALLKDERLCSLHHEKLNLFCLDDQQLACVVCRESRKHTKHRFYPTERAAKDNKKVLQSKLKHLQERLKTHEFREQNLYDIREDIETQSQDAERQIKKEFAKLHQLLLEEEEARIKALRKEEERKRQTMMDKISETSRQISSLLGTIQHIEEQMNAEDISFLENFNTTMERYRCAPEAPDLSPPVRVSFSKHLGNLKLSVLQKIQDNVAKTSYFSITHSDIQPELSAISITDGPVKISEYKHLNRGEGKSTKLLGAQTSKESRQHFPRKVYLVHKTNKPLNLVSTKEEIYDRAPFTRRHPPINQTTPIHQTRRPSASHKGHAKHKFQNSDIMKTLFRNG